MAVAGDGFAAQVISDVASGYVRKYRSGVAILTMAQVDRLPEFVPFTRDELWEAVYLGHRQDSNTAPILPDVPGCDIRDYLCGETIAGDGHLDRKSVA